MEAENDWIEWWEGLSSSNRTDGLCVWCCFWLVVELGGETRRFLNDSVFVEVCCCSVGWFIVVSLGCSDVRSMGMVLVGYVVRGVEVVELSVVSFLLDNVSVGVGGKKNC